MLPEDRYRVSTICINFLKDILKYTNTKKIIVYLKSKHNLNSNAYPKEYVNFINSIENKNSNHKSIIVCVINKQKNESQYE